MGHDAPAHHFCWYILDHCEREVVYVFQHYAEDHDTCSSARCSLAGPGWGHAWSLLWHLGGSLCGGADRLPRRPLCWHLVWSVTVQLDLGAAALVRSLLLDALPDGILHRLPWCALSMSLARLCPRANTFACCRSSTQRTWPDLTSSGQLA